MDKWFQTIIGICGAAASFLFGGWSSLLTILLSFVIIDYITGVIAAGMEGKLNSNVGFKGIIKKVMIFIIVAVANLVDESIGQNHIFRDAVIFFYLANELLSILENAGRTGLPIPDRLKSAVEILRSGKGESK